MSSMADGQSPEFELKRARGLRHPRYLSLFLYTVPVTDTGVVSAHSVAVGVYGAPLQLTRNLPTRGWML
jgi:hypothetical protein